jgi:hypothetical protein
MVGAPEQALRFIGAAEGLRRTGKLERGQLLGAAPDPAEVHPVSLSEEAERLLVELRTPAGPREARERLDHRVAAAEGAGAPLEVRDRLVERRGGRSEVALVERGPAEDAETDAAERVAVHVVGSLH